MLPKSSLLLRSMTLADLPAVMEIDQLSFEIPWSEHTYRYEIGESSHSFMLSLEEQRTPARSVWTLWRPPTSPGRVVGYGGLWLVAGEAHVSTIAVHPHDRGRGWGELLLAAMVARSVALGAEEVTLEVRVSNRRAQNLYRKYEFEVIGVKYRYYRNNNEDAYEMRLPLALPGVRQRFLGRWAALRAWQALTDRYTGSPPAHWSA